MITKKTEQKPRLNSCLVEDPFTCGFIKAYDPVLSITPEPSYSGRVGFRIEGEADRIRTAFQALSDDCPIGARSLIAAIKYLRIEMFRVKAAGQVVRHE